MWVGLIPFFRLFNKKYGWIPGAFVGAIILLCLPWLTGSGLEWFILVTGIFLPFVVISFIPGQKSFKITAGQLLYVQTFSYMKTRTESIIYNYEYLIPEVEAVELHQNALEKLFNTGTVVFIGEAAVKTSHKAPEAANYRTVWIRPQFVNTNRHTFYGVRYFDDFCKKLYNQVNPNIVVHR